MGIEGRELDRYFIGKGSVLDHRVMGLGCVGTHRMMLGWYVWAQLVLEDGYHSPQVSYRTLIPPPTPREPPAKSKRTRHSKAGSEAQLIMVLHGVLTVVCSALNWYPPTYSSKTAIQL